MGEGGRRLGVTGRVDALHLADMNEAFQARLGKAWLG